MIKVKDAIRFFKLRHSWLGEGGVPVGLEAAQQRADTCLVCPKHEPRKWQEYVTGPVANVVRGQLEIKTGMKLAVANEDKLHTCGICECYLPLKVWVPLELARQHTPDWQNFPSNCWLHSI